MTTRIKNKDVQKNRELLMSFGYEQLLIPMPELALIFGTTKQNISKILGKRVTKAK
jgi:hypothetical protein